MDARQVAVITGASAGIGRATAHLFAREGYGIYLTARRLGRLQEVAGECSAMGAPEVGFGVFDLSVPGNGHSVVSDALSRLGRIDILVLNAGYGCFVPVHEYSSEKMVRMWQVNYQSAYESIQEALPFFLNQGSGHIVLISSVLGKKGIPFSAPYCATKFALVGLGQALWGELRDQGIGVSVICPGYTSTEFHQVAARESGQEKVGRPMKAQGADRVAVAILDAIRKKRLEVHLTWQAKAVLALDRLSNGLANRVMAAAGRSNR